MEQPGTENDARVRERSAKRAPQLVAARLATVRCRWNLTLEAPKTSVALITADAALAELRKLTADPSLSCTVEQAAGPTLILEGTWSGYLQATKAALRLQLGTVCGWVMSAIEPAFTKDYQALFLDELTQPTLLENFVQVYGPLFLQAVKHTRSKYARYWNLPTVEELLTAVWERCITKLASMLDKYSASRAKQTNYLYIVAKNIAHDVIRPLVNDPEDPTEPDEIKQPATRYRTQEILEKREILQKLMTAFSEFCEKLREKKRPGDWEFFQEHFLKEMTKEEMCKRYDMTSNAFDMRVHRIRERLSAILDSWRVDKEH